VFELRTFVSLVPSLPISRIRPVKNGTCNLYILYNRRKSPFHFFGKVRFFFTTQKKFFSPFEEKGEREGGRDVKGTSLMLSGVEYGLCGGILVNFMWGHLSQFCRSAFIETNHSFIRQRNHGIFGFSRCFQLPTNTGRLCVRANIQYE
jgi:hypothetical protein